MRTTAATSRLLSAIVLTLLACARHEEPVEFPTARPGEQTGRAPAARQDVIAAVTRQLGKPVHCGTAEDSDSGRAAVRCAEERHRAHDVFILFSARDQVGVLPERFLANGWAGTSDGSIYAFSCAEDTPHSTVWPCETRLEKVWPGSRPMRLDRVIQRPQLQPEFSMRYDGGELQGLIILDCEVAADGSLHKVQVMKELANHAGVAAADAIRTKRFKPATLFGEPIPVVFNLSLEYRHGRISTFHFEARPR